MPVHAQVEALLRELIASGRPSSMSLPLEEGRRNFAELIGSLCSSGEVARTRDLRIPGPAGDIPARAYFPAGAGDLPVVLHFHGGGWVFGDVATYDGVSRALAAAAGAVLVSVDYRRAPEDPFPAALDDCHAATAWVHEHAAELGCDPSRLAVAGDSSGGNLAAAVALRARDEGGPPIAFQLLVYPALDPSMSSRSYGENAEDAFLSRSEMAWYWDRYLGPDGDRSEPYAAPLAANDLSGLPPAHVVTAGSDVLRDEGETYAARLRDAGVPATVRRYDDMVHGFLMMGRHLDAGREGLSDAGRVLREALARVRDGASARAAGTGSPR